MCKTMLVVTQVAMSTVNRESSKARSKKCLSFSFHCQRSPYNLGAHPSRRSVLFPCTSFARTE